MANRNVNKLVVKLSVLAVAMFVFAIYVLPPLYDVFCEITGINGKGQNEAIVVEVEKLKVDEGRSIRMTFIATNNEQMPWEFKPNDPVMVVHPGEVVNTSFHAKNTTDRAMVSRAIPSYVPSSAAEHVHKVVCFCFENQPLDAGESAEMGIQYYVDADLPKHIKDITVSYTIFDLTETESTETESTETQKAETPKKQQVSLR